MGKTILLADDSLTIQKVVELTFSDTDFELIATSSGDDLLERLPTSGADIVICDTIMPGTDGYAVCQAIKSESSTLHIPVILMTGTFEPFDRDRALAAGCSEIVTKPFEARNLVETVERLVSGLGVAAPAPEAFAGSVAPPDFPGTVAPPVAESTPSEFGTMLSPPPDVSSQVVPPAPEFSAEVTPPEPEYSVEVTPPDEDFSAQVTPPDDDFSAEVTPPEADYIPEMIPLQEDASPEVIPTHAEDELDFTSTGFAEMEAAGAEALASPPPPPEHGLDFEATDYEEPEAEEIETADFSEPEPTQPIPTADFQDDADPFAAAAPGIFADSAKPEFEAEGEDLPSAESTFEEAAFSEPPVEEPEFDQAEPEAYEAMPVEPQFEDSVEVRVHPPEGFPVEPEPDDEPAFEPEPVDEPESVMEPEPEPEPERVPEIPLQQEDSIEEVTLSPVGRLSDADVDRIARRVVELSGDKLEKIAWEVIPDMAEIVVRERLRELENEIDSASGSNEPN